MKHSYQTPVREFKGAPEHPELYPGFRPPTSYLLAGDEKPMVSGIYLEGSKPNDLFNSRVYFNGKEYEINDILHELNVDLLEDRIPVLGYGSNANPERLLAKFHGKGLDGEKVSIVIPTFKARIMGFDVVFTPRVTQYGSVPADMTGSQETETEIWVNFLDDSQIVLMHDSEGLRSNRYYLGQYDSQLENGAAMPSVYGYVGATKTFIDPQTNQPVRFASSEHEGKDRDGRDLIPGKDFVPIDAKNPKFAELCQIEIMEMFNDFVFQRFSYPLFESEEGTHAYRLTDWSRENIRDINDSLKTTFGRELPVMVEQVEEPYRIEGLKRLRDRV